ncbi:hypothetical protein BS78_03G018300 [Paspalum vaginatum]|nr:hypothetical protein BS78_03G018300 [Paspalum vaginatum]
MVTVPPLPSVVVPPQDAVVARPAGGTAEEGLAVGEVVERNDGENQRGQPEEVTGVGIGVAGAKDGGEEGLGPVAAAGVRAAEQARDGEEHGGGGGDGTPHHHGCTTGRLRMPNSHFA